MNRRYVLILAVAGLCGLLAQAPLWPQDKNENKPPTDPGKAGPGKDAKKAPAGSGIEGTWIVVTMEVQGQLVPALPSVFPPPMGAIGDGNPWVWKITKNKIETNVAGPKWARHSSDLEIHPDGKAGWINSYALDKDGKRDPKSKGLGIYHVKDDLLITCSGGEERPTKFSTSPQDRPNVVLYTFRRSPVKITVNGALKEF